MRILWQGFTSDRLHGAYTSRLVDYLNEIADEGTTFDFAGIEPPDRHLNRLTELRCAVDALRSAVARKDDYDAIVLGHFQDAGLWELRSALELPVLGLGESSMLHACTLGFRIGLITIHPTFISWHEEQVRRYGLQQRIVGVRAIETSPALFMEAFENPDTAAEVRRQFEEQARPLVDAGVEVLIPAGGLPALLFGRDGEYTIDGAVVVNAAAVVAKSAEAAVKLRRQTGLAPSRRSTFRQPPPEALAELLETGH